MGPCGCFFCAVLTNRGQCSTVNDPDSFLAHAEAVGGIKCPDSTRAHTACLEGARKLLQKVQAAAAATAAVAAAQAAAKAKAAADAGSVGLRTRAACASLPSLSAPPPQPRAAQTRDPLGELQRNALVFSHAVTAEGASTTVPKGASVQELLEQGGFLWLKDVLLVTLQQLISEFDRQSAQQQQQWKPPPRVLLAFLQGRVDPMHTRIVQALFASRHLSEGLMRLGFEHTAVFMRTVHEAFEAMNASAITQRERDERMQCQSELLYRLLGNRCSLPMHLPASISGQTSKLICSLLGNADARLHLLDMLGPEGSPMRMLFNEASCSTDIVENLNNLMASATGYKAAMHDLNPRLGTISFRQEVRSNPNRGFDLAAYPLSTAYAMSGHAADAQSWGSTVNKRQRDAERMDKISAAAAVAAEYRAPTIRGITVAQTDHKK